MDPVSIEARPTRQHGLRFGIVIAAAWLHAIPILVLASYDRSPTPSNAQPEIGIPVIFKPAPAATSELLAADTLNVSRRQTTLALSPLPGLSIPAVFRDQPARHAHVAQASNLPSARPSMLAAPMQKSAPAPAADLSGTMAKWEGRIREAVQEAAVYPAAARMLHHTGRAQIRFTYDLGMIKDASVAQTSRSGALDSAAITAVTTAAIPPPPTELGPQKRIMLVWIQFSLTAQE